MAGNLKDAMKLNLVKQLTDFSQLNTTRGQEPLTMEQIAGMAIQNPPPQKYQDLLTSYIQSRWRSTSRAFHGPDEDPITKSPSLRSRRVTRKAFFTNPSDGPFRR